MKSAYIVVGFLLLSLASAGCGKLSDAQKQAASDIASGLAGETGKGLANNAAALTGTPTSGATSKLGQALEGAMWLTRFKVLEPMADQYNRGEALTGLGAHNVCDSGDNTYCDSSCPTDSIFKVACNFGSTAADYTCNSTQYELSNATFSITADFTNTGGAYGAATGNFGITIAVSGGVSGGALDGKVFDCSMNFTVDVAGLKNGTVTHFSPSCDNFSCTYDGKALDCADVQAKMASSTISCS